MYPSYLCYRRISVVLTSNGSSFYTGISDVCTGWTPVLILFLLNVNALLCSNLNYFNYSHSYDDDSTLMLPTNQIILNGIDWVRPVCTNLRSCCRSFEHSNSIVYSFLQIPELITSYHRYFLLHPIAPVFKFRVNRSTQLFRNTFLLS